MSTPLHICWEVQDGNISPMQMASVSLPSFLVSFSFQKQNFDHLSLSYNSLFFFFFALFADLTLDKEELYNVAHKFPVVHMYLDKLLRSIVDYPKVSTAVHLYNKKAFSTWRDSLGRNYSSVIANLRWHVDWQNDVLANERAIDRWLYGSWWFFFSFSFLMIVIVLWAGLTRIH